jgi:hypothetical protein
MVSVIRWEAKISIVVRLTALILAAMVSVIRWEAKISIIVR